MPKKEKVNVSLTSAYGLLHRALLCLIIEPFKYNLASVSENKA